MGEGEDGIWTYDGLTVYTYKEGGSERLSKRFNKLAVSNRRYGFMLQGRPVALLFFTFCRGNKRADRWSALAEDKIPN